MKLIIKQIKVVELNEEEIEFVLKCLRYCRHRVIAHDKKIGINNDELQRFINELSNEEEWKF